MKGQLEKEKSKRSWTKYALLLLLLSVVIIYGMMFSSVAFPATDMPNASTGKKSESEKGAKTTISGAKQEQEHLDLEKTKTKEVGLNLRTQSLESTLTNTNTGNIGNTDKPLPKGCLNTIGPEHYGTHMVKPPEGLVTLVCCETTKGVFNIAVHDSWAPVGAENFLTMVKTKFFSTRVPLFRALKGFIIQFGLSSDMAFQKEFEKKYIGGKGGLKDDPSWLPLGPTNRELDGVKRFQKGYLAYAGAGKNSRGTQLIVSFQDNKFLAGT